MFCAKFLNFLLKKSLKVTKNRYRALEIKIEFIKKLELKFLTIKTDNKVEIINNVNK